MAISAADAECSRPAARLHRRNLDAWLALAHFKPLHISVELLLKPEILPLLPVLQVKRVADGHLWNDNGRVGLGSSRCRKPKRRGRGCCAKYGVSDHLTKIVRAATDPKPLPVFLT
ncbi:MAG: hypothetical protein JNK47_15095 [Mesorhizobium sp.]|nr:hypothetical protein [Mesorhizobium sp.]MBL8578550.1 hypothetical protein [Mesorhizobium sp.]